MAMIENTVDGAQETSIRGISEHYTGVWGESHGPASGVYGKSTGSFGVNGESDSSAAVRGTSNTGRGVEGWSQTTDAVFGWSKAGWGVNGYSESNTGIVGSSETGIGVQGIGKANTGVAGISATVYGVTGEAGGTYAGVKGTSSNGTGRGVEGWSTTNSGVWGVSTSGCGLEGVSTNNDGVRATSEQGNGLSARGGHTGVFAAGTVNAGFFEGNVFVKGDLTTSGDLILAGADVAEQFDVAAGEALLGPGTVAVLDESGSLRTTDRAYDVRVAGIVSGLGDRKPALVLDRHTLPNGTRAPLAVVGKAWCLADATGEPIAVGDLLTTAARPGYAMRVQSRLDALGATVGKALTPLAGGTGQVLVLVGLA